MSRASVVLAATVLLSGCGSKVDVADVAPLAPAAPAADPAPSAGDGGGGGAANPDDFEDCMHRFDDVELGPGPSWQDWRDRGAQPTWRVVSDALRERFETNNEVEGQPNDPKSQAARALPNGYVAALFDSPRDRIVVVADPASIDHDGLRTDLNRIAERAQRKNPVRNGSIVVEVFAPCVPASRLAEIRAELSRDREELDYAGGSGPRIDSRIPAYSRTAKGKREMERRYGDLVDAEVGGVGPG